mgnify:CR=1 FL=1
MTMRALFRVATPLLLLLPLAIHADDLTGAEELICATVNATECFADGSCTQGEPETWNIPRFLRVNLATKTLSTTQARGDKRTTP